MKIFCTQCLRHTVSTSMHSWLRATVIKMYRFNIVRFPALFYAHRIRWFGSGYVISADVLSVRPSLIRNENWQWFVQKVWINFVFTIKTWWHQRTHCTAIWLSDSDEYTKDTTNLHHLRGHYEISKTQKYFLVSEKPFITLVRCHYRHFSW